MSEHEPRPTPEHAAFVIDYRRLEVAASRFANRINGELETALREQREIDIGTARMIAHVLGRAHGPSSALAMFGRTGEGDNESLRADYLALYADLRTPASVKTWIDWLGTYFVDRDKEGSGRQFQNEHLPPQLSRVLYRDEIVVSDRAFVVQIPGTTSGLDAVELAARLEANDILENAALQAFLTLRDVNAMADNLMESFQDAFAGHYPNIESALRALSPLEDWENELADWSIDHGVEHEALQWNLEPLVARLRDIYDLVEMEDQFYAFIK